MSLTAIAFVISFFFAINIGASGSAASMATTYGAGAIKKRWIALLLVAIAVFFGAYLGCGEVVKTIGKGIIPSDLLSIKVILIILSSACATLFLRISSESRSQLVK